MSKCTERSVPAYRSAAVMHIAPRIQNIRSDHKVRPGRGFSTLALEPCQCPQPGGNVSAHATHLVRSAFSDPYIPFLPLTLLSSASLPFPPHSPLSQGGNVSGHTRTLYVGSALSAPYRPCPLLLTLTIHLF